MPNDGPLQKPDTDGATSASAASTAVNTTSAVLFEKKVSGSGPTSRNKGQTHQKLHKKVSDFDQLSRQSRSSFQETDETYSPLVQDVSGSAKDQEQPQPKKEIADCCFQAWPESEKWPQKRESHSMVARDHMAD